MKKSVLASIKPKYCELIASGKKTVEIRKTRLKIDVPFKVYMYQTRDVLWFYRILEWLKLYQRKVIGEFVCDRIEVIDVIEMYGSFCHIHETDMCLNEKSCLLNDEIDMYLGNKKGYAWHISNLVIYDKPKELSEFHFPSDRYCKKGLCGGCPHDARADVYGDYDYDCEWKRPLTRPPQSWCYVEELEEIE